MKEHERHGAGRIRRLTAVCLLAGSVAVAATGCGRSQESDADPAPQAAERELSATTPAGTREVDEITWAVYREPTTLDGAMSGDYPEAVPINVLCETVLRMTPEGQIGPGLATSAEFADPRTLVIDLRDDVTFADGSPMTAEDVVYSLDRIRDPRLGSWLFGMTLSIASVQRSGPNQVTIRLNRPDRWVRDYLASQLGIVHSKRYVERAGRDYGTPKGGVMCTGPYELGSWDAGQPVRLRRNDAYWNPEVRSLVREIEIVGVPDQTALTNGLLTGEIDGTYLIGMQGLDRLRESDAVDVHQGPSFMYDAMVSTSFDGPLGDPRVRRALSLAIDRQGLVDTIYRGAGEPARAPAAPGTWVYGSEAFADAWDALGAPRPDPELGRRLVEEAGMTGEEIVFATSTEEESIVATAEAYRRAAESIGLKPRLKAYSAAGVTDLWIDPEARARSGVDGIFGAANAMPGGPDILYSFFALPGAFGNFTGWKDERVVRALDAARTAADPEERARHVVAAQEVIAREGNVIPNVSIDTVLVLSSDLTGAPASPSYVSAPWTDKLGGKG